MQPASRLRSFSSRQLPTILANDVGDLNFRALNFGNRNCRVRAPPEISGPPRHGPANSLPILAKSWKPLASKCRIGTKPPLDLIEISRRSYLDRISIALKSSTGVAAGLVPAARMSRY